MSELKGMKRGRKKKETDSEKKYNTIFAYRLRELFSAGNESQEKTAAALNVTRQTFGNWLNGRFQPDLEAVARLAEYYDVSLDYLLGRTKVKPVDNKLIAVCNYTHLSEHAAKTLSDLGESEILSEIITDPEYSRLIELLRTKINGDDRLIEYGEGEETVSAMQSELIDFNIGKVISSVCDRIKNKKKEEATEIHPEKKVPDETVEESSRALSQEEYEDMLEDLNNGLYIFNPYAYE